MILIHSRDFILDNDYKSSVIGSDNESELISKQVLAFYTSLGIQHECGVAEFHSRNHSV